MNRDYELAMLTEPDMSKVAPLLSASDDRYELIVMSKIEGGRWVLVGQANDLSINEVAGAIQCTEHEHFSYVCPLCMSNRNFLRTLQHTESVTRVDRNEPDEWNNYAEWTMEIAHVSNFEYTS